MTSSFLFLLSMSSRETSVHSVLRILPSLSRPTPPTSIKNSLKQQKFNDGNKKRRTLPPLPFSPYLP